MRSGPRLGRLLFPQDVNALRAGAREQGYEPELLDATVAVNDEQPRRLVDLQEHVLPRGPESRSLDSPSSPGPTTCASPARADVIENLQDRGAAIVAYDPVAIENVRPDYPEIEYADRPTARSRGRRGSRCDRLAGVR